MRGAAGRWRRSSGREASWPAFGPAAELSPFGIPVVADLPVGRGLQDHMLCAINYLADEESLLTAASPVNAAALQERGRGPLTSNIDEAGGFLQTRAGLTGPDVQLHSAPVIFFDEGFGEPPAHGTAIAVSTVSPEGQGQVRLRSASPDAAPIANRSVGLKMSTRPLR